MGNNGGVVGSVGGPPVGLSVGILTPGMMGGTVMLPNSSSSSSSSSTSSSHTHTQLQMLGNGNGTVNGSNCTQQTAVAIGGGGGGAAGGGGGGGIGGSTAGGGSSQQLSPQAPPTYVNL